MRHRRSGDWARAAAAAAPRSLWKTAGFHTIHALTDHTNRDTATDPNLSAQLLRTIGKRIGETAITTR
ncbi:hypothetical protein IU500_02050 [Nocardia terpenica]|uniref:hypothetical protein n=1 Tax=Nocardia terpenica TaxID=455432 RepID=UPI001892FB26|nr:hypothetical protein [Nocardia terpenica]MBF6059641.1 hypothetical protein [Nocardia terpenica]MBF6102818.1 hypothetical protein [Nocardia terpenica]MBF6110991.1 hypothetical protein [Nocardia terpenica]MBF6117122.1 hypothetical protein [Nocardia terpenica]MBF6151038.1 hypothetical protein [Nocardia terpenica]